MITDTLFRTHNFKKRKVYNDVLFKTTFNILQLCDSVVKSGGEVCIFSSKLYTGEKLDKLGGVSAILRFPLNMDYLDETQDEEEV